MVHNVHNVHSTVHGVHSAVHSVHSVVHSVRGVRVMVTCSKKTLWCFPAL